MGWENLISLLGGGAGVFILKLYSDWHKTKRGDTKDVVGAWQQIADREAGRLERLETRISSLENILLDRDFYIKQIEAVVLEAGLKLPKVKQRPRS